MWRTKDMKQMETKRLFMEPKEALIIYGTPYLASISSYLTPVAHSHPLSQDPFQWYAQIYTSVPEASPVKSSCVFLIFPCCYTFLPTRCNYPAISSEEYKSHNSMCILVLHFLMCNHGCSMKIMVSRFRVCVTIDRLWIGEWIYLSLIHRTRKYK
jgi:hypothetical protein